MKRVLVTGARGFIGRCCLYPLMARGYEVHAVHAHDRSPEALVSDVSWHRADLLQPAQAEDLLNRVQPTHLLHLAWYAEPGKFWSADENFLWVRATLDLMGMFARFGGKRAVMAGSCAEYNWRYGLCSETFTPCEPGTLYGTCKHVTRSLFEAWSRETGIPGAWGRIFFLYGPHEHPTRLVRSVIDALLQGRQARCTQGTQRRDFLHVEDVAGAFVALLDSEVTGPVNIASGVPIAVREVVACIARQLGASQRIAFGAIPGAESQPPLVYADISRLRDEVRFTPRFDLESGIAQTIKQMMQARPFATSVAAEEADPTPEPHPDVG